LKGVFKLSSLYRDIMPWFSLKSLL